MKVIKKAILPLGFSANAVAAGIKKSAKLDLALFYSQIPAKASLLSTTNKIPSAPIQVNNTHLKKNKVFNAIIANSGNANAFTGIKGLNDAKMMAAQAAAALGIKKESVLVASTGVIGRKLKIEKINYALGGLVKGLSKNGIGRAKIAIMTTDKFVKEITVKFNLGPKTVTLCGVAKGAGMIAPNMATMLCFIFTDANIAQGALNAVLKSAVGNSFNSITVDGCMSTNDTVIVLANGRAKNKLVTTGQGLNLFSLALEKVCLELAKMIIKDGEGATKFITIKVNQANNPIEAKSIALAIANSNLFKIASFASSKNIYGRIVAAVGACGVSVKEKDLKIGFSPLKKPNIVINVGVGQGKSNAVIYTSDLSHEYVKINADYN